MNVRPDASVAAPREEPAREGRDAHSRELLIRAEHAESSQEREQLVQEVVLLNTDFAEAVARRYRGRGISDDDLVQIGCLGLLKACHGFDSTKGSSFLSYAVPTIRGEVRRFFRDNAWVIRPPRRIQELQAAIKAASAELSQSQGAVPSAEDLAQHLDVDVDHVNEALVADGCYTPASLDQPAGKNEDLSVYELLGDDDGGYYRAEALIALRPLCQALPVRDSRILYLRFFCEWTQQRIADDLGITQMQVSRLLARILTRLRTQLTTAPTPPIPRAG